MTDETESMDNNIKKQDGVPASIPRFDPYVEEALTGKGFTNTVEVLLKRPGQILHELRHGNAVGMVAGLLVIVAFCLAIYGVVVGSLSGASQLWIAPLKVVAGTLLASLICLPSLYVFLCLSRVDAKLGEVAGSLAAMVGLASILLVGLAPVGWVFSQSTDSIALMAVLHLIFWGIAIVMGSKLLGRFLGGRPSGAGQKTWLVIYLVVCLQMMTSLRPIIGRSEDLLPEEKKFFVEHFVEMLGMSEESGSRTHPRQQTRP